MADIRNPVAISPLVPQGRPPNPARTEAIRNAQRAFFQAALSGANTPAATPVAPAAAAQSVRADVAPDPGRPLRPGSLLDIKV